MLDKINWHWDGISILGKNKLVQRAYFFFFLVPILAKVLVHIKGPIELVIGEHNFKFLFELPFNWKIFFYSALCFAMASVIYELCAPKIIKENESMRDFLENRKGMMHIEAYMNDLDISDTWIELKNLPPQQAIEGTEFANPTKNERKMLDVYRTVRANQISYNHLLSKRMRAAHGTPSNIELQSYFTVAETDPTNAPHHLESEADYISMSFWTIFKYANMCRPNIRLAASIFYLIGFLLLLVMFANNIYTVFVL